jgi:nucleotidyltransferase substrate binding protein (TIGR01987 family)
MSDRVEYKLQNFQKAIERLREAVIGVQQFPDNRIIQDGLIQRFEFIFELAWKTSKVKLETQGLNEALSPKAVLKELYSLKWIDDETIWLEMLKDRNMTSHVYDERVADEITDRVMNKYLRAFEELYNKLNAV